MLNSASSNEMAEKIFTIQQTVFCPPSNLDSSLESILPAGLVQNFSFGETFAFAPCDEA